MPYRKVKTFECVCRIKSRLRMNTFLSILLFVIYVPFSTGVLINFSSCNGSTDDIALFKSVRNCCPDNLLENSCCKQVTLLAKINANYESSVSSCSIPPLSEGLDEEIALRNHSMCTGLVGSMVDHRSKVVDRYPIYLINRVFII
jgi:hypothetical protein